MHCSGAQLNVAPPPQINISNIGKGASVNIGSQSVNHRFINSNNSTNTSSYYDGTSGIGAASNNASTQRKKAATQTRALEIIDLMDDDDDLSSGLKFIAEKRALDCGMRTQAAEQISAQHSTYNFDERKHIVDSIKKIQMKSLCSRREAIQKFHDFNISSTGHAGPSRSTIAEWETSDKLGWLFDNLS
jgi:hypothetical protein